MSGQHTGVVSDAINHEAEGGARARLARVVKPSGRVYTGRSDLGNGDPCPAGHGKMFVLSSGTNWCPNQSHDAERAARNG